MREIFQRIHKPTLLLDQIRAAANIRQMAEKAKKSGVRFRPHFKTHQSAEVGEWFRQHGTKEITVSSVEMAQYFAAHGWDDITIAFPANIREIAGFNELAPQIKLNLLVESPETVAFLQQKLQSSVSVWIKIDVGYHRTGIPWDSHRRLKNLAEQIRTSEKLKFAGLLTHAGHTYHARSRDEIRKIFQETKERMQACADLLRRFAFEKVQISVGDTPGCSIAEAFFGVDEIRPGNFVFFDVSQWLLGSCSEEQIAVALACPVVAKHEDRGELVIFGGGIHLSKENVFDNSGRRIFGYVVELNKDGWGKINPDRYVSSLSQEHGIVKTNDDFFQKTNIGDLVAVLPTHSCLTVNLMKQFITLDGKEIRVMSR
ncbi:MAG: alanine racemase [Calditrichaeota bacterium]|nr:alanine racemase [Calditrichota bacterium]